MNEGLSGLSMFDRFTLRFTNRSPLFTPNPPRDALPLLRITYTNYPVYEGKGAASGQGAQGGERWAIEILPIPYQHRELFKAKIVECAIPLLREWLNTGVPEGVRKMTQMCWFEPASGAVTWVEDTAGSLELR